MGGRQIGRSAVRSRISAFLFAGFAPFASLRETFYDCRCRLVGSLRRFVYARPDTATAADKLSTLLFIAHDAATPAQQGVANAMAELRAPAGVRPVKIDLGGETILPNGGLISAGPAGQGSPASLRPGAQSGREDPGDRQQRNPSVFRLHHHRIGRRRTPGGSNPAGLQAANADPDSVFMGVAVGPDNRTLYLSEGNNGRIGIFDIATHRRLYSVSIDGAYQGKTYANSLTASMQLSPDGRRLYVLDLAHFRLVVVDTDSKDVVSSIPVGRMPFGLALSPDGKFAYVSNVGMFNYTLVPGYDANRIKETGLDFPPFGFPSKEAAEGATVQGKAIPGLGDPNVPEAGSLWVIHRPTPRSLK